MPTTLPSDDHAPITCSACLACCCKLPVLLLPGDDPPECYVDVNAEGWQIMGKGEDGWCLALDRDTLRCTIYAQRPWVCREFAMAGEDCREVRADHRRIAVTLL
jgi:Fe-S-cluster containining protein